MGDKHGVLEPSAYTSLFSLNKTSFSTDSQWKARFSWSDQVILYLCATCDVNKNVFIHPLPSVPGLHFEYVPGQTSILKQTQATPDIYIYMYNPASHGMKGFVI